MNSLDFNYQLKPFDKTIQLYGDRAGGQGNFDFAGLAELQTMKFVLLIGNPHSLEEPSDWRRFLRLLKLAKRLHKPVVLWNLQLTQNAAKDNPISLELATAIQKTKLQLLRLPQPIIIVYDQTVDLDDAIQGMRCGDGVIVVKPEKEKLLADLDLERQKLIIVCEQAEITIQILQLLEEVSKVSGEELVVNRIASFSVLTEIQT